jgi:peptide/nickel transport system permease protein
MMGRALRRLAWVPFVVWACVTLSFGLSHVLPSDPARLIAGAQARPQDVEKIRAQLGLGAPMFVQYARYLSRVVHRAGTSEAHDSCAVLGPVHVDLGKSYQQRRPVVAILMERLPRTVALATAALLLQLAMGIAAGVAQAQRPNGGSNRVLFGAGLLLVSAPTYLTGLLLQYVFGHRLGLLPLDGFGETTGEHARSLVLPALTLGLFGAAYYARIVRDDLGRQLRLDFVRTARAKGGSSLRATVVHALRASLLPLVTLVGLDFGALLGGAVVTETVFRWPGIGSLAATAVLDRDGPVVMGTVLLSSAFVAVLSALTDISYGFLDPRLRRPSK